MSLGGMIGGGGSSGKSQTQVNIPGQTADEQALIKMQLDQAKQAAADQAAYKASPDYALDQQVSRTTKQNLVDRLTGKAPVISPEAQQQIDTAYGHTQQQGLRDINQSMQQDANARGLSTTDSPVANAKGLALGEFESGLGSAKAQSALNLGNTNALFNQSLSQFQDQLRMNQAMNAMQTSTGYANPLMSNMFANRAAQPSTNVRGSSDYYNWNLGGSV